MTIDDRIFGKNEIADQVLIDLIKTSAIQRLKGINQYGMPMPDYYSFPAFSRFEHSIGVMLLLRKSGAGLNEQIAGLIHDISHTAFSHLTDWIWGNRLTEDYQDNIFPVFLKNSEDIIAILNNHGIDPDIFSDLSEFRLLEREASYLCADRIDYSLREFHLWAEPSIVEPCIKSLTAYKDSFLFDKIDTARDFAYAYLRCQMEHWGGLETVNKFYRFAELFKEAMKKNVITKEDFFRDDEHVLNKLSNCGDKDLIEGLAKLKGKTEDNMVGIIQLKKFRYVDPEILLTGQIRTLSSIDQKFKDFLHEQSVINSRGICI